MIIYIVSFIAIMSALLLIISLFADIVNNKVNYLTQDDENEKLKVKYKITLAFIMSLSWAYILFLIIS